MKTIKELVNEWGVKETTLKYWCQIQHIPAIKKGTVWLIPNDIKKPAPPRRGRKRKE